MKNKYNMTKEDNIFFAKRKLVDNIYKSANLEGIAVTFADIYAFMNNVNTGKISVDDMLKLKGLKDAWEYVLNSVDEELTIDYIKKENIPHKVIADVCTGSGCIAIYLKKHFPDSDIYATDKYKDVLEVAKSNFEKYQANIITLEGNRLEPLISRHIRLDVLISNPPYVEKMEDIEDKVKKYEPLNAIYIQDGTKFYESYFKHHKEVMKDKFFMAFEINYDQEEKLTFLIRNYFDLNKIQYKFVKDIFDKTRYLFIKGDYSENSK